MQAYVRVQPFSPKEATVALRRANTATKKSTSEKKPEKVGIGSKLRKAYPWFETASEPIKKKAIEKRRKEERQKGVQLASERLIELSDELERIQRELNPLEIRRKEILAEILPHWGHTGIEEIEGKLGKTLISTSAELCVDQGAFRAACGNATWLKTSERTLQPRAMLDEGKRNTKVRDFLATDTIVSRLKVVVTPPSSRRPKSGETELDEVDDAA